MAHRTTSAGRSRPGHPRPHRAGDPGQHRQGPRAGGGAASGVAQVRQRLADHGGHARRLGPAVARRRAAGFSLRLRSLRKNPGFAAVVILTLGFGTAINTATFSIVNAALIRPLGFAEPERLVALHEHLGGFDIASPPFSAPDFLDLQRDQQSFESMAAFANVPLELSGHGEPIRIDGAKVSANLFSLLGIQPLIGRDFRPDEDRPGVNVAVLSWGLWQTRYGGDRSIVGRTVTLDRRPYTVIGIMPAGFEFPRRGPQWNNKPASVWVPVAFTEAQRKGRGNQLNYSVIGRLKGRQVTRRSPGGARCPGTTDQRQLPADHAAPGLFNPSVRGVPSRRDRRADGAAAVAAAGGCRPRAPRDVRKRRDAHPRQGRVAHA